MELQDKTSGKFNFFLKMAILLAVGIFIFTLVSLNRQQVQQNESTLRLAEQLTETSTETQQLICDIILALKQPTEGQLKACAEFARPE